MVKRNEGRKGKKRKKIDKKHTYAVITKKCEIHIVEISAIRESRHFFSSRVIFTSIRRCWFFLCIALRTKLFNSVEVTGMALSVLY